MVAVSLIAITIILSIVQLSSAGFAPVKKPLSCHRTWNYDEPQQLVSLSPTLASTSRSSSSSSSSAISLRMWSREDDLEGSDRLKACIPYMLPLLDGDSFGKYIYMRIPPLGFLHDLWLGPLVDIYNSIPFSGILFFVALTLGTRGNTEISRGVRFSAQQAAMIDVALLVPLLIGSAFTDVDLPRSIVEPSSNFVWYTYMIMVVYSIYSNLRGKKPDQIPFISSYAELLVGPM